jgi:AcrR family transcriptional regulator
MTPSQTAARDTDVTPQPSIAVATGDQNKSPRSGNPVGEEQRSQARGADRLSASHGDPRPRDPGVDRAPEGGRDTEVTSPQAGGDTAGRARLTRDAFVEAADAIVREDGASALSMRRLAERVGASTMAAYRHVKGRGHLGGLVLDHAFRDLARGGEDDGPVKVDDLVLSAAWALRERTGIEQELTGDVIKAHPDLENLARWHRRLVAGLVDEHAVGVALALVRALARDPSAFIHGRRAAAALASSASAAESAA